MSIHVGNTEITDIGNASEVYVGDTKVWPAAPPPRDWDAFLGWDAVFAVRGNALYKVTGKGRYYQLGIGNEIDQHNWVLGSYKPGLISWVGSDYGHHLIVDGKVQYVGRNRRGEAGIGNTDVVQSYRIVEIPGEVPIRVFSNGNANSVHVLCESGNLYYAGVLTYGVDVTTYTIRTYPTTSTIKLLMHMGSDNANGLMILEDGSVLLQGRKSNIGMGNTTTVLTTWTAAEGLPAGEKIIDGSITVGSVILLTEGGDLWYTGVQHSGQLGTGTDSSTSYSWVKNTLVENVTRIVAHGTNSINFIEKEDGNLYSAGYNLYGQLGVGDTKNRNTFTYVRSASDVIKIECNNNSMILTTDRKVLVAGIKQNIGLGTSTQAQTTFVHTLDLN